MARMYDMETVNKAMTEAAKLYARCKSIRARRVLDIFAAMRPVEVEIAAHGAWETRVLYDGDGNEVFVHTHHGCGFECRSYKERGTPYCPNCGAIMDGRVEE